MAGQTLMFDHEGRVASNAAACRREALRSVTPTMLRAQHRAILEALRENVAGMTDEEGIRSTGLSPSSYRPRRGELVTAGQVEDSGETRRGSSGRAMTVWVVVA